MLRKRTRLPEGEINLGIRRMRQVVSAAIRHHTDDLRRGILPVAKPELLSDGGGVGKVSIRQSLVHHGYTRRVADIGSTEVPSIQNRQPQQLEVVLGDGAQRQGDAIALLSGRGVPFYVDRRRA